MSEANPRMIGLGTIGISLAAVAVGTGLLLGALDTWVGLPQSMTTAGVGAVVGVALAILIARRRAPLGRSGTAEPGAAPDRGGSG